MMKTRRRPLLESRAASFDPTLLATTLTNVVDPTTTSSSNAEQRIRKKELRRYALFLLCLFAGILFLLIILRWHEYQTVVWQQKWLRGFEHSIRDLEKSMMESARHQHHTTSILQKESSPLSSSSSQ
jgi:hypothetical protein